MSSGSGHTIPHTGTLFSPLKIIVGRMTISETPHTVRLISLATRGFRHLVDLIGWTTARYRSMLITIRQKMLVNWFRESWGGKERWGWRTKLDCADCITGEQAQKHQATMTPEIPTHKYQHSSRPSQICANWHSFEYWHIVISLFCLPELHLINVLIKFYHLTSRRVSLWILWWEWVHRKTVIIWKLKKRKIIIRQFDLIRYFFNTRISSTGLVGLRLYVWPAT